MHIKGVKCTPRRSGKVKGGTVWVCTTPKESEGTTKTEIMSQKAFLNFLLDAANEGESVTMTCGLFDRPPPKPKRPRRQK